MEVSDTGRQALISSDSSVQSGPGFGPSNARRSEEAGRSTAGRKEFGEGRAGKVSFPVLAVASLSR